MNNIAVYFMLAIGAIAVCGLVATWFYNEFIKDTSPRTELRPSRLNTDTSLLRQRVNFGEVGEPLLFYGKAKKEQLRNDVWRTNLPNYTASNEKRGLVVGASGTGKTNYIYSQIVDCEPPRLYRRLIYLSQAATPDRIKLS